MDIYKTDKFKLTDSDGNILNTQFRVLSRYNGIALDSSKQIRVVLMTFQTDINANKKKIFYLSNENIENQEEQTYIISETDTHIIINTGKVIAKINKNNFNFFDEVFIDADNDNEIDDRIVQSDQSNCLIINSQEIDYIMSSNYKLK